MTNVNYSRDEQGDHSHRLMKRLFLFHHRQGKMGCGELESAATEHGDQSRNVIWKTLLDVSVLYDLSELLRVRQSPNVLTAGHGISYPFSRTR